MSYVAEKTPIGMFVVRAETVQKYVKGLGDKSCTPKHKHTWPSSSTLLNALRGHSRAWIPIKSFGTINDLCC